MASTRGRNGRWTGLYHDADGKQRSVGTYDDRKMLKALEKSGLADATVAYTLIVAKGVLGDAACEGVKFRVRDQREMLVVTREQARLIEDAILERYKLLVRALFSTGCR
jgi:hypothetical protein